MTDQQQNDQNQDTPSPTQDVVQEKVENVVNEVTGKDLSEEVQNFVSAGKKLLDSVFSEVTSRFENKIKEYLSRITK